MEFQVLTASKIESLMFFSTTCFMSTSKIRIFQLMLCICVVYVPLFRTFYTRSSFGWDFSFFFRFSILFSTCFYFLFLILRFFSSFSLFHALLGFRMHLRAQCRILPGYVCTDTNIYASDVHYLGTNRHKHGKWKKK